MPSPHARTTRAVRATSVRGRNVSDVSDASDEPYESDASFERPYGEWYPLVRLGHFLLMSLTSCLIILVGFAALGVVLYLATALLK